jgi:hypothetical protein
MDIRKEVKACIRWYERRGKDWTSAVEFLLLQHSGLLQEILAPWRFGSDPR